MTIGMRTNNYDIDRPPLAFGIEWSAGSSDPVTALTRLGDAASLQVNTATGATYAVHTSDFSNYMPWAGMRRVSLNHNGDYTSIHGEVDGSGTSTFDESTTGNEKIMVEIPKFWYLVQKDTPVAGAWSYWVSPYPLGGFAIHPAFVRGASGTTANILDHIYVGAYEAYVDATNAAFPSLYSVANVAPTVSKTREQFRSYATNMGTDCTRAGPVNMYNYGLMDWQTWQAVALLYLVEYGSLNSMVPSGTSLRGGLSAGITNDAAVEKTGWTSSEDCNTHSLHSHDLGNSSGQVKCNTNGGNAVWAMSYRGIENLWGNTWTILDAINIDTYGGIWLNYTGEQLADQVVGSGSGSGTLGGTYSTTSLTLVATGHTATVTPTISSPPNTSEITVAGTITVQTSNASDSVTAAIYRTLEGGTAPSAGSAPGVYDTLVWSHSFGAMSANTNYSSAPSITDTFATEVPPAAVIYYVVVEAVTGGTAKEMINSTLQLTDAPGIMGAPYTATTYTANATAGNPKYPTSWDSYHDDEWMFEQYTMGASTSTYMCSAYTVGAWASECYPRMGGKYNSGAGSGIFCEDLSFVYASNDATTGARLQYIPAAGTYYKY